MKAARTIRWGILGTANIARAAFLPALREAGDGDAFAVAGRDEAHTRQWAAEHGVANAVDGYDRLLSDPTIEAVYIPLPNALHASWATRAMEAGKTVLCEKPLCVSVEETENVLATARRTGRLLWEAFVFPFHAQMRRVRELLDGGAIGELREIQSNFHFQVGRPDNIRLSRELAGGSLMDVGCYPIRLGRLLFSEEPTWGWADANWGEPGVDVELWGALGFSGERRLLLSVGFHRAYDAFTRLMGSEGQIHLTNPFHPGQGDTLEVRVGDNAPRSEPATSDQNSFTAALRHIHRVVREESAPEHLAIDEALGNARAIELLKPSDAEPAR